MPRISNKSATRIDKLIGEAIRVHRLSKGLTQGQLGSKLGVTADSDQFARLFRSHLARDSELMSPRVPISNRPGDAVLPVR